MSDDNILAGSPLARALDDFSVPGLSAGFADRVIAAAETRAGPLPELRRATGGGGGAGGRGWRMGQRIAIATLGFGALATAAAATGVLERFDIPVPSPQKVWASMTGTSAPAAAVPAARAPDANAPAALIRAEIKGPIDTPEELGEAFRRIDEVRKDRSDARRQIIDQRIDRAIERRRAAGLPVPDAKQEARLRQRIEAAQVEREGRAAERIEGRRQDLRERVENGEPLTRENLIPNRPQGTGAEQRSQRLRDLTPEQRRELLRNLPAEDRRALADQYRRLRDQRQSQNRLPTTRPGPAEGDNETPNLAEPAVEAGVPDSAPPQR